LWINPEVTSEAYTLPSYLVAAGTHGRMEIPAIVGLIYVAIGAAIFAHPRLPFTLQDFHWRRQIDVFRDNFRDVMIWPLALYMLATEHR
jgi:hypothetical protein